MSKVTLAAMAISGDASEILGQLFVQGPTWDGDLISKGGRSELVERGLAERWNGWNWLTLEGIKLATSVDVRSHYDQRWHRKANCLA